MSDDWRSYRQGKSGWSPTSGTNMTEWRRGRNHALLGQAFDFSKHGGSGNAGAGGAGAVLLLLVFGAIAFISHLGGTSNKSAPEQSPSQPQTTSRAYTPIAKPPAGHPAGTPQALPYMVQPDAGTPESGTPGTSAGVTATSPAPDSTSSSTAGPYRFAATHKEFGGGCEGELLLTSEGLHFTCPGQPDINVPLAEIDRLDNDGVRLVSGKKYHFKIPDDRKAEVESIFGNWLDKARQNRAADSYTGSNAPPN
jgi:hypothetical protein